MPISRPTYLRLSRHNVYYFRWPLPAFLLMQGKARHIEVSLGTRIPSEALRLSKRLEYHADRINQKLVTLDMSHADAHKALRAFFTQLLEMEKQNIDLNGALPEDKVRQLRHAVQAIEGHIQGSGTHADEHFDITDANADRILALVKKDIPDLDVPKGSAAYEKFKADINLPYLSYCKEVLLHNSGLHSYDLSTAKQPVTINATPSRPLKDAIADFVSERMRGKEWTERTKKDRLAQLELLTEILGDKLDIARVDAAKASEVKKILQDLPKSRNKNPATRGLPVRDAILVPDVEKLHTRTVNEYLTTYQSFFGWCEQQDFLTRNPFKKLVIRLKSSKQQTRKPFTPEQIRTLLSKLPEHKETSGKTYRYWATLIGAYTGARLNEIAQLQVSDIKQEDGVWYFDLNDEGEGQQLKTENSRRRVPLHDKLIELGLLDYVRSTKGKQLFPDLKHQPNFGYGRYLGKWFNEQFLTALGIKVKGLSFHSLRHTFITTMRKHADNVTVKELVGHSKDDVTEDVYVHGYDLKALQTAVNRLSYE